MIHVYKQLRRIIDIYLRQFCLKKIVLLPFHQSLGVKNKTDYYLKCFALGAFEHYNIGRVDKNKLDTYYQYIIKRGLTVLINGKRLQHGRRK